MRAAAAAIVPCLAAILVASSTASLHPTAMTLQQGNVPSGYVLDKGETMDLTPHHAPAPPYGLVTGQYTVYRDTSPPYWRTIKSVVLVLRGIDDARRLLRQEVRAATRGGVATQPVRIGSDGVAFSGGGGQGSVSVAWRHGRVVATVVCEKVERGRAVALSLARVQERRIAAELR